MEDILLLSLAEFVRDLGDRSPKLNPFDWSDGEVVDIRGITPIIRYGYDKLYYRNHNQPCGGGSSAAK